MKSEQEEILIETIMKMDDKQKAEFLTEIYIRSVGIFFLIEFLKKKGVVDKEEYAKFVEDEMKKARGEK